MNAIVAAVVALLVSLGLNPPAGGWEGTPAERSACETLDHYAHDYPDVFTSGDPARWLDYCRRHYPPAETVNTLPLDPDVTVETSSTVQTATTTSTTVVGPVEAVVVTPGFTG